MNGLPDNLYSGGAVVFNSKPYTDFYLNSIAKKRQREDALENYYRDFGKTINPAGMRNQDVEGWMSKTNDWRGFYQQNKARIQNPRLDNGRAQSEYFSRVQDLQADVQKSKNLGEISKQYVVPIVSNPEKRTRLHDNSLQAIHAHDASMYDTENHKELDPSVIDYSSKPFDIAAQKKLDDTAMKGVKMSNMVQGISIDPKTKSRTVSYHASYSPEDLQSIGGKYADAYSADDSFANAVDDIVHDQDALDKYGKVFKSVYGRDMEDNKDLAAAYGLSRVQSQQNTEKVSGYNPYNPFALKKYGYDLAKDLYDYKDQVDSDVLDNKWNDLMDKAGSSPQRAYDERGHVTYQHDVPVTFEMKQAFGFRDNKGKIVYPDRVRLTESGDIQPIYFKYDDKGAKVIDSKGHGVVDTEASVPISQDDAKIMYGKTLFGQSATNKQTIREKTVQQPGGTMTKKITKETKKDDPLELF